MALIPIKSVFFMERFFERQYNENFNLDKDRIWPVFCLLVFSEYLVTKDHNENKVFLPVFFYQTFLVSSFCSCYFS